MDNPKYQTNIAKIFATADIQINGTRPWDMQVNNPDLFARIIGQGSLGLGEAYMDGWWDCEQLDEFFHKLLATDIRSNVTTLKDKLFFISAHLLNRQKGKRSLHVAQQHYDAGNDLYEKMLDEQMIYTCGYWQDAGNLNQAQQHKLELVCRKLKLQSGMRVLDIGCGWGGTARYMAEHYDVEVVGITISEEQVALANQQSGNLSVEFRFQDYRQLNEKFDRIYSLGMFEHVGFKNYADFFKVVDRSLNDNGLFLLQTIGHRKTSTLVDPWIERYIFPNSILPSAELISKYACELFAIEDWHNFGLDYQKTLLAWNKNIESSWHDLPNYDQKFQRMWHYYLMCCAGAFKSYKNHLWQIVFSKGAQTKPYTAVRSAL